MSDNATGGENTPQLKFGDNIDVGGKVCQIFPYEYPTAPELLPQYENMKLSDEQKGQIAGLYQAIPSIISAGAMKNAYYVVKWPAGLPHELVAFRDGSGVMSMVRGEGGKFGGHAHFLSMGTQAALLGVFTLMSIVTCQFFLSEINRKLTMMNQKLDKILEFLYGDKRAELLSEVNFVQYAHQNFRSMMRHSEQRAATIQSLQATRKVAIQDVEFYLLDLASTVHGKLPDNKLPEWESTIDKVLQNYQCLELSIQLYMTACLLEVYYSQNYDPAYLKYVEDEVGNYIDNKYEKQLIADFNFLQAAIEHKKKHIGEKNFKALSPRVEEVDKVTAHLMNGDGKELKEKLRNYSVIQFVFKVIIDTISCGFHGIFGSFTP